MMRLLLSACAAIWCGLVLAEEFDATVIAVMDGDTVLVVHDGLKIKIRLVNIDAPESSQEFGKESRLALMSRVLKKQVHVNSHAIDKYGRMVAEISIDGKSVNEEQVQSGMAWEYSHFHRDKNYLALQTAAQQSRRGLWGKSEHPLQPGQWRKLHPFIARTENINSACGKKHRCAEMQSCDEAMFYLTQCRVKSLDANLNGVPCEGLCVVENSK